MGEDAWLAERFEENRRHLRAVAYRMLGPLTEADDAVQEAWLRLSRSDPGGIHNLRGWLTTVVARVCLDMPIVGRTPAAARQLASRARRRVQGAAAVPDADLHGQREVVAAFLAAARGGDFEALLRVLDPDVEVRTDAGRRTTVVRGAKRVARGRSSAPGRPPPRGWCW